MTDNPYRPPESTDQKTRIKPMSKKMAVTLFLLGFTLSGVLSIFLGFKSLVQLSEANYSLMAAVNLREELRYLDLPENELRCTLLKLTLYRAEELSGKEVEDPILYNLLGMNLAGVANSEIREALEKFEEFDFSEHKSKC